MPESDSLSRDVRPRYLPDEPFPPYSYVTGRFPHPIRDPTGHSFGINHGQPERPDPAHWQDCRPYLRGLDLFNHGYYWEAHEVWESLWHACERTGPAADFFKGLIKLAAAGVKVREGRHAGVRTHAARANELFKSVADRLDTVEPSYFGLKISQLRAFAQNIVESEFPTDQPDNAKVHVVFTCVLRPG